MVLLFNGSQLGQKSSFCFFCGRPVHHIPCKKGQPCPPDARTIDHTIPRARGGKRGPKVTACRGCNEDKHALTLNEYRAVIAYRAGLIPLPEYKFAAEQKLT